MKSDHFDGKKYFNLEPTQEHGLPDILRWKLTTRPAPWPKWVENPPYQIPLAAPAPGEMRATFINHASVLIETESFNFLTDPVWSQRASPSQLIGPARVKTPGRKLSELPRIDAVLVSHNHYDHLDLDTLQKLERQFSPQFYVARGDLALLKSKGLRRVQELDWWEATVYQGVEITFLPSQHWSARGIRDRCKSLWGAFGLKWGPHQFYFAGDTGFSSHFKATRQRWGQPSFALLPIGAYEPRWFMKDFHMNPPEAVRAFQDLQAKTAMGIHFGSFQLTDEAIDQPVIDLAEALKKAGLSPDQFFVLPEGQSRTLGP